MAGKKKHGGLGKGLDALFSEMDTAVPVEPASGGGKSKTADQSGIVSAGKEGKEQGIDSLPIDHIKPNSNQPRKNFRKEAIDELAASIKEHGVIQPIIVRPAKHGYEIVAGERRWRAAREAGLREIPCIRRDLTEEQNILFAMIENMQREDLNPIEEAEGLARMSEEYSMTQEQISARVGKSRPYIANSMRLLKLPKEVRELIAEGRLSGGHGKAILALESDKAKVELAKKAAEQSLSVRETEELASGGKAAKRRGRPAARGKDPNMARAEEEMKEALGTRVTIRDKGRKGAIEIEYYSRDELDRLIEILKNL